MKLQDPLIVVDPIKLTPGGLMVVSMHGSKLVRESNLKKMVRGGGVVRKHAVPGKGLNTAFNSQPRFHK